MTLPATFLQRPIAHRALHGPGCPENSRAAIRAAIAAGYGIEIDLQLSSDGQAMVFHDYELDRLTAETGMVRQRPAAELGAIPLTGGDEGIPTFDEVLALVAGRVPLLVELKDQDGRLANDLGPLEQATARAIAGYDGPLALMSFNPHSMDRMATLAPQVPRGLTTCRFDAGDWPVSTERLDELTAIPDFDRIGACFVSHHHLSLDLPRIAELKAQGVPVLCWTIRSPVEEASARRIADNITFEGYAADLPA